MSVFFTLLRRHAEESARTWRLFAVPVLWGFMAIIDPILARFTPELLKSTLGDLMPTFPEATSLDAWTQWTADLGQTLIIVAMVVGAGTIAGEIRSGTAMLVLSKPVSRSTFVLAGYCSSLLLVTITTVAATGVVQLVTTVIFPGANAAPLWRAVAVWLVLAAQLLAVVALAACLTGNTLPSVGIGIGVLIVTSIAGLWGPIARNTFAGLGGVISRLARGNTVDWQLPVLTSLVLTAACIALALATFQHREL